MKKNCIVFCALLTLFLLTGHAAAESDRIDDFFFDGCSSIAPEGTLEDPALWCECCLEHDVKYWKGGTWTDRRNADLDLMDCVAEKSGSNALGLMYYLGVRMGGSPFFLTPYRWGYGWEFGRGYQSLTDEEEAYADFLYDEYLLADPEPCASFD